jgi:hypothetical protein
MRLLFISGDGSVEETERYRLLAFFISCAVYLIFVPVSTLVKPISNVLYQT